MSFRIIQGNCFDGLKTLPDNSIDSIVTDPPYGLSNHSTQDVINCLKAWVNGEVFNTKGKKGFMGADWDAWVPGPEIWKECLRVLKPGGHLLAFAGTRSMDLMGLALRLAGFELRDGVGFAHEADGAPLMAWAYRMGMPKGANVSKAIDKKLGVERTVIGHVDGNLSSEARFSGGFKASWDITAATSPEAKKFDGWHTGLRPAWEPILVCRKAIEGTLADNVLKYGVGGMNVAGTSIADGDGLKNYDWFEPENWADKWTPNMIHDGSEAVSHQFDDPNDARFCFVAKPNNRDRHGGLAEAGFQPVSAAEITGREEGSAGLANPRAGKRGPSLNTHTTVKPTALMHWLVKLVTPPGGTVLDPFNGSGSTGRGAMLADCNYIGMELSEEYVAISTARIEDAVQMRKDQLNPPLMPIEPLPVDDEDVHDFWKGK